MSIRDRPTSPRSPWQNGFAEQLPSWLDLSVTWGAALAFGFNRGAYTARSLAGLIAKLGILKPGSPIVITQLYDRYKRANEETIWRLADPQSSGNLQNITTEERWLLKYSQRAEVKVVGVWDTVGSLGLKAFSIDGISRSTFDFLETGLQVERPFGKRTMYGILDRPEKETRSLILVFGRPRLEEDERRLLDCCRGPCLSIGMVWVNRMPGAEPCPKCSDSTPRIRGHMRGYLGVGRQRMDSRAGRGSGRTSGSRDGMRCHAKPRRFVWPLLGFDSSTDSAGRRFGRIFRRHRHHNGDNLQRFE
jgi:hypothetical protein